MNNEKDALKIVERVMASGEVARMSVRQGCVSDALLKIASSCCKNETYKNRGLPLASDNRYYRCAGEGVHFLPKSCSKQNSHCGTAQKEKLKLWDRFICCYKGKLCTI